MLSSIKFIDVLESDSNKRFTIPCVCVRENTKTPETADGLGDNAIWGMTTRTFLQIIS